MIVGNGRAPQLGKKSICGNPTNKMTNRQPEEQREHNI